MDWLYYQPIWRLWLDILICVYLFGCICQIFNFSEYVKNLILEFLWPVLKYASIYSCLPGTNGSAEFRNCHYSLMKPLLSVVIIYLLYYKLVVFSHFWVHPRTLNFIYLQLLFHLYLPGSPGGNHNNFIRLFMFWALWGCRLHNT